MNGLELARAYYETYGKKMLETYFPEYVGRIAIGLVGEGSECMGYDDTVSYDHDFEPAFCLWLTKEDAEKIGKEIGKRYQELPDTFMGFSKAVESAYGANRRGVKTIGGFYAALTGDEKGPQMWQDWFLVPEYALANATNGEVFRDDLGEFTSVRQHILHDRPEDVRLKKIAARAASMAQSGQYNFERCLKHGEAGAAQLALHEFVLQTVQMVFLLNKAYCPYYKWMFRRMRELPILGELAELLEQLLGVAPDKVTKTEKASSNILENGEKQQLIETICENTIKELKNQKLTDGNWDYLEPHAFSVMERITNEQIRGLHVLQG